MHSHYRPECEAWWDCDDSDDCPIPEKATCGCDEYDYFDGDDY